MSTKKQVIETGTLQITPKMLVEAFRKCGFNMSDDTTFRIGGHDLEVFVANDQPLLARWVNTRKAKGNG